MPKLIRMASSPHLSVKEFSRYFSSKEPGCTAQELHVRSEGEEVWGIKAHFVFFLFMTEVLGFHKSAQDRDCQEGTAQVQAHSINKHDH